MPNPRKSIVKTGKSMCIVVAVWCTSFALRGLGVHSQIFGFRLKEHNVLNDRHLVAEVKTAGTVGAVGTELMGKQVEAEADTARTLSVSPLAGPTLISQRSAVCLVVQPTFAAAKEQY